MTNGAAPTSPTVMSDADVQAVFGAAMAVQAPAALRFLLYFELGGDTLTDRVPGAAARCDGRRAAGAWRPMSASSGTRTRRGPPTRTRRSASSGRRSSATSCSRPGSMPTLIEVVSHGESNPLVPTDDNIAEAEESTGRSDRPLGVCAPFGCSSASSPLAWPVSSPFSGRGRCRHSTGSSTTRWSAPSPAPRRRRARR